MLQGTCYRADVTKPETMGRLVAVAPRFSTVYRSDALVSVDYHSQPAWETPNFSCLQNIITLFVGESVQAYQITAENGHQQATYTNGRFGIYPAYQSRIVGWKQEAEFIDLYLPVETITHYADASPASRCYELLPQFAANDILIYSLGSALKQEAEQNICDVFYIESAMTMLIAHLLRHYSTQGNLPRPPSGKLVSTKLNRVIDYIHAHLEHNPSLIELASLVELSSCHFVKVFKQATGTTPHQYLLKCRIEKAKQLLSRHRLSIAEIAQLVGFHDQSRFTSTFRRKVGVTPKQYRDSR